MVGPTREEATSDPDYGRLKWGFVALIGLSGGMVALQGGATPRGVAAALLVSGVVGFGLVQYLAWSLRE